MGSSCEMAIFSPTTNSFQTEVPILGASGDRLVADHFVDARLQMLEERTRWGAERERGQKVEFLRRKITSAK